MNNQMTLSEELQWRGFYNQATFSFPGQLDQGKFTLYLGADPTGDSLHVGHLAVYMLVRRFIERGHKVVLLVGGGTGIIGDPGGKQDERVLLSLDNVASNTEALKNQVGKLFDGFDFEVVDNYDWLKDVSLLEFLRDIGKHYSMSQLVQRDYIQARIGQGGQGMSYAEFSYTLLQGYDFWHLHGSHGVNLQVGGSDQWGNILSGVDLIRKKDADDVHGMTAPLVIDRSTGRKFGKSEGGAVWLDANKTSVYQFYQFWLNVDDDSALDYIKLFTLLGRDEIEAIIENHTINPSARSAQKTLAHEVTVLVHGRERTESVVRVTEVLFGNVQFSDLSDSEVDILAAEIPTVEAGVSLVDALCQVEAAKGKNDARRLVEAGAVSVNGEKVNENQIVDSPSLVKKGKNNFILVR